MHHRAATSHPDSCPALVLNADFRPLSYYPLSLWSWQDAIKAVFLERVNIVSEYDHRGAQPELHVQAAQRCFAEELHQAGRIPSLHPLQRVSCAIASNASIAASAAT